MFRSASSKILTVLALGIALALASPPPARTSSASGAMAWILSWLEASTAPIFVDEGSGLDPHG